MLITGIQLLLSELAGVKPDDLLSFGLSIAVIFLSRRTLTSNGCTSSIRSWPGWPKVFANFHEVIDWALEPVSDMINLSWRLVQRSRRAPACKLAAVVPEPRQPSIHDR